MKRRFSVNKLFITVAVTLLMASCKVTQPYTTPDIDANTQYRDVSATDTNTIAAISWEEFFNDATLTEHIKTGLENNPGLTASLLRIQQAEAYFLQSKSAFYPTLSANAGLNIAKLSEAQGMGIRSSATQYELGLSSSWEVDIWGKLQSSKRAQYAALLQTEAASDAIKTALVANIANLYYTLLTLDEQLAITRQTIENWDQTVATMRELKTAGRVTEAAVVQSEAQKYAAEVTIPDLIQRIKETENRLNALIGNPSGPVKRTSFREQKIDSILYTGIPAQLLMYRPDVREAELNYRYFYELTNIARTYFYPSLTITGSAGFSALELSKLLDPTSLAASIGAGLLQPITNRRANKTRLEVAEYQQEEAYINFRNSLLLAGEEISNALSMHQTAGEKIEIRKLQMDALEKSVDYSLELLQNGFANYTEVITARQSLLQAELGEVSDRFQQATATVSLYRSLGGGWQ